MKFSEIPYTRPDPDKIRAGFNELIEKLRNAKSYEETREAFLGMDELERLTGTMYDISFIRRNMFEDDEFYKEERAFWRAFDPELDEFYKARANAMLDSPFRAEFAAEFGDMMLLNAEFDRKGASKAIVSDQKLENELIAEYGELTDEVEEIPFEGEMLDPDAISELQEDVDGERRLAAFKADGACWREVAPRIDDVFDKLIHLREEMGKKLGYDGFIDLIYCILHRTFTKEDVAKFREAVVKYAVPVADAIKREQAKRIGRSYPMAYSDNEFFYKNGNPHPAGDGEFLVKEAQRFFDSLSPETGEFFRHMVENEMLFTDAGGGVDLFLAKYRTPFLMVGLDGSGDSVRSFMHEAGHTFAYWMNRDRIPVDYAQPSEDITELHSMCMELIALKNAEGFFGADARKFTYALIAESIAFITYGTMVDHFQHIVHEHPDMMPAERHAEWLRLEGIYEPWILFDGSIPYYGEGMLWQQQGHIFDSPFMYIDYVLTGVVGLEVWALMQKEPKTAWERYMALVRQGGTRPFTELLENAGLKTPFDEECLKTVCETAKEWLDNFDLTGIE
ncbi:MAG: M3 family oligoendopeptidase [Clostridia bacterium]|nr:M3 family oligoendopeptidase [Clostridia bacterium]